mmetsp:Transcript_18348/g.52941  ORF Transcript_18348/g.52941 Transcript_18348/m.52941 type:complete len:130 (+) Transcript_18348:2078-2467(+)
MSCTPAAYPTAGSSGSFSVNPSWELQTLPLALRGVLALLPSPGAASYCFFIALAGPPCGDRGFTAAPPTLGEGGGGSDGRLVNGWRTASDGEVCPIANAGKKKAKRALARPPPLARVPTALALHSGKYP